MDDKPGKGNKPSASDLMTGDRPGKFPWQTPKHAQDDPRAAERIRQTLSSPGYRLAERDPDFLGSEAARGPRLMLDYLKPELGLQAKGIGHAVVVFGSTRIPEPAAARRNLDRCHQALAQSPDDQGARRAVDIAERVVAKSRYYEAARALTDRIARSCDGDHGERVAVVTGGGPGLMEAANRGSFEAGGNSVGLNIALPHEQFPNPYLTRDLCFQFHYFAMRKLHFLHRARALVAFPGGFGTFDELFETLVLIQTQKIDPLPVVLVGQEFWSRAVDFAYLVDEGVIEATDRDLFTLVDTADEAFDHIARWYVQRGNPIFGRSHQEQGEHQR